MLIRCLLVSEFLIQLKSILKMLRNGIRQRFRFINIKIKILIMLEMSSEMFDISLGFFNRLLTYRNINIDFLRYRAVLWAENINLERGTYICNFMYKWYSTNSLMNSASHHVGVFFSHRNSINFLWWQQG